MHWHHIYETFWITFALGGSIFVHEFGHYWAAKRCGLWVPRFSIGFGPKLFSWRAKDTRFQIALIPLGGYVALPQLGDQETGEGAWDPPSEDIAAKIPTFGRRIGILSAGVIFNMLFALCIACILWAVGIPTPQNDRTVTVGAIPHATGSMRNPLAFSELSVGDQILSVDGVALQKFSQLPQLIAFGTRHMDDGQPSADLQIRRGDDVFHLEIPVSPPLKGENRLRHIAIFSAGELSVETVLENSPAQRVGIRPGDQILAVDGRKLFSPIALDEYLQKTSDEVNLTLSREGRALQIFVQPQPLIVQKSHMRGIWKKYPITLIEGDASNWMALNGPKGIRNCQFSSDELAANFSQIQHIPPVTHRVLGITFSNPQVLTHPNPFRLFSADARAAWRMLCSLANRHSDVGAKNLIGFFGMGRLLHHFVQSDLRLALAFIVSLNIGIAFLNLLPIPGLDGGLIFFAIVEKIIHRPLPKRLVNFAQGLCIFLLFLLLIYVCVFDVLRWRGDANLRHLDALYPSPEFATFLGTSAVPGEGTGR
ncbi:MAG: RIP metalloprotease RseP [Puniceicoccales bacterium]|jgi:regulator of sigma E protease|nr:RIP metalloprotease RseP [Puniceicoccales bacterium]